MRINFVLPMKSQRPIGGFKIVYQYANELVALGHDVHITYTAFLPKYSSTNKSLNKLRFTHNRRSIIKQFKQKSIKNWIKIDGRIKEHYPVVFNNLTVIESDVIIATMWFTAIKVNKLSKTKGEKFHFIQHYEKWSESREVIDCVWKLPLKKIVIAKWLQDIGKQLNVTTKVVNNFIHPSEFYLTSNIELRKNVISMLYHLNPEKGTNFGLSVLEYVKKNNPDTKVILFGTPERPNELPDEYEYIQSASIYELREKVYNISKVYVMPSKSEGWGLTATEAMACGATLVSTFNGGVEDFTNNGDNALLSSYGDIKTMGDNILNIINNEKLRLKLSTKGIATIKDYSIRKSTNELIKIFNS